jgi:cell division initiation protein
MLMSDDQTTPTEVRRLPSPERTLTVSPLDLRQSKFQTAMRGFDRNEVTSFLLEAADGYEQALRDNDKLRQEVIRLEASLVQYRDLEGSLKTALMTAQKVADDMQQNAAKEAARIIREAEARADLILQETQAKQRELLRDIDTLRARRHEAAASVESIIAVLHSSVDFIHRQGHGERHEELAGAA